MHVRHMCFSCINDDVPLISYSTVGGQISPLRKIFSSVGYLRKCLDPLGGKELNPSKNELMLAEEETLHLSCGFGLGSRLQGVQMF